MNELGTCAHRVIPYDSDAEHLMVGIVPRADRSLA